MESYRDLPDGQMAVIAYPNVKAMITGISVVYQDKEGNVTVDGINGNRWSLGIIEDGGEPIDIQREYAAEREGYLSAVLMKYCD